MLTFLKGEEVRAPKIPKILGSFLGASEKAKQWWMILTFPPAAVRMMKFIPSPQVHPIARGNLGNEMRGVRKVRLGHAVEVREGLIIEVLERAGFGGLGNVPSNPRGVTGTVGSHFCFKFT